MIVIFGKRIGIVDEIFTDKELGLNISGFELFFDERIDF